MRKRRKAFAEYSELRIDFLPTYKFITSSHQYDAPHRKPAWTDRILYRHTSNAYEKLAISLTPQEYKSHSTYTQSDHKPVSARFTLRVLRESARPHVGLGPAPLPRIIFKPVRNWAVYQDCSAIYTTHSDQAHGALSLWDWVGLFRADFNSLDDHVAYVWASTRPMSTSSSSSSSSSDLSHTSNASNVSHWSQEENAPLIGENLANPSVVVANVRTTPGVDDVGVPAEVLDSPPTVAERDQQHGPGPVRRYRVTFSDQSLLAAGSYRLVYVSHDHSDILGISDPFEISG